MKDSINTNMPLKIQERKKKKKKCLPSTFSCIFWLSTPGAFFTLHWYVPVSADFKFKISTEPSPDLGSELVNCNRPLKAG